MSRSARAFGISIGISLNCNFAICGLFGKGFFVVGVEADSRVGISGRVGLESFLKSKLFSMKRARESERKRKKNEKGKRKGKEWEIEKKRKENEEKPLEEFENGESDETERKRECQFHRV
jgi:hypothetical protein